MTYEGSQSDYRNLSELMHSEDKINKFTPGPWRIAGKGSIRTKDGWIATVNWRNRDANARLLAAAPELLAALKALTKRLDDHFGGNPDSDWKQQEDARAAISKAEGA